MNKSEFRRQLKKYGLTVTEAQRMFGASRECCVPSPYESRLRFKLPESVRLKFEEFKAKETEATRYFRDLQKQLNKFSNKSTNDYVLRSHVEKLGLSLSEANGFLRDENGNSRIIYKYEK